MRRKDREITDAPGMMEILEKAQCMHMGINAEGRPYVVPLSYGFEVKEDQWILYFHSAQEGRKIELLRQNPDVFVEIDTDHDLLEAGSACGYGYAYSSWMAEGTAREIEGEEKRHGLTLLMKHYTGRGDWQFTDAGVNAVMVYAIVCKNPTAKRHEKGGLQ